MKLKKLISDLENREVEEATVLGRNNNWVATCRLEILSEASSNRYLEEMSARAFDFFGITYIVIEDDEDYIEKEITEIIEIEERR